MSQLGHQRTKTSRSRTSAIALTTDLRRQESVDLYGLASPTRLCNQEWLSIKDREMEKHHFFDRPPGLTVAEIISLTGAETSGTVRLSHLITDVAPADLAGPADLTFIE